jgi:hypothetical protein
MNFEDDTKSRKRRRVLVTFLFALLILLLLILLFFLGTKNDEKVVQEETGAVELERTPTVDYEPEVPVGVPTKVVGKIELPPPISDKNKEPIPYVEPIQTNVSPVSIGSNQKASTYTYDQLKNLKRELIQLCFTNAHVGLDGMRLRDNFIRIVNSTLALSISPDDPTALDVVYQPQVDEVIQSIDTVTCKDKNPAVPTFQ